MTLKILSWNIWTDGYFDQVIEFLKESKADIIGLQEVVGDDPKRDVIGFLNKIGYQHVFAPIRKDWGDRVMNDGPALFSKHKILKTEKYILSKEDSRAAVGADIQVGNKTLHVFSTHLIHTHQQHSEEQDEQAAELLGKIPPKLSILMGDFNATPDSTAVKKIKQFLIDTNPASKPTWSVYPKGCPICKPQKIDTRLDYIFTTKDIKTSDFKVEKSKASDHLPISVLVEI